LVKEGYTARVHRRLKKIRVFGGADAGGVGKKRVVKDAKTEAHRRMKNEKKKREWRIRPPKNKSEGVNEEGFWKNARTHMKNEFQQRKGKKKKKEGGEKGTINP